MTVKEISRLEKAGRLVVLPCAVGDKVFIITERYFECEECRFGSEAKVDERGRKSCDAPDGRHCPLEIEEKICEGYGVYEENELNGPGEWGWEGLEEYSGVDGMVYYTLADAQAALEKIGGR